MQGLLTKVHTWKRESDTMSSTRMNRQVIHAARDVDAEALLSEPRISRFRVSESLWEGIKIDNK
jgi:hypothetical protein